MGDLRLYLLGPFQAILAGQPVQGFAYDKVRALLAYLAVEHRSVHSREFLGTLLWPEANADTARMNLRKALSTLRKALCEDAITPHLLIGRDTVQFNPDSHFWLDVDQLKVRLNKAPDHSQLQFETFIPDLEEAAALYRGGFLQGLMVNSLEFEEWMLSIRENLHTRMLSILHELTRYYLRHGEYCLAQKYALRQVELEPYREEARRSLMLALARSGQRSAALAQYETCKRILADELGVDPSHETEALYQRIRQAGQTSPHNLPASLPDLIGRERDLQAIAAKLADPECRLLTITGPGGIGKTSLATHVACENLGAFWDGVYFVPLGALTHPDQIVTAIIGELPFSLEGPTDPTKQLLRFLEKKTILLILDNMEHLLEASRWIADLLSQTSYLKIVVTSRERLNLKLEWVFLLQGLSHPEETSISDPDQLPMLGAVQLFVRRARQVSSGFSPSSNQYVTIARICRLLHGVPLGIELAAAWIAYHDPRDIEANIRSGLDFLATTMLDVHPRHASLRATFEYSWRLLSPAEKDVLQKLSVFRDTFTLEAARQVADANRLVLNSLVDKSLIGRDSRDRYGLHSLIGEFVAEKLAADPVSEFSARTRFNDFFAAFLYQKVKDYHDDKQRCYLDEIQREIDNARAMWTWALDQARWDDLDRAHEGLYDFFDAFGWYQEGYNTFENTTSTLRKIQNNTPDAKTSRILGRLLARQARLMIHLGLQDDAQKTLEESVGLLQDCDDRALPLSYLGLIAYTKGDYAQAIGFAEESLAISRKVGGREGEAFCLNMLGNIALARGELDRAREIHAENLAIRLEIGDHLGAAMARNNLANIAHAQGRFAEAKAQYQGSHQSFEMLNHRLGMAATLSNAGYMASKLNRCDEAKQLYEASLAIKRELGNQQTIAVTLLNLCELSTSQGELTSAKAYFYEALKLLSTIQAPPLLLEGLVSYSEVLIKDGDEPKAVELLALVHSHSLSKHETQARASGLLTEMKNEIPADVYDTAYEVGKKQNLEEVVSVLVVGAFAR